MQIFFNVLGMFGALFLAVMLSHDRKNISFRVVAGTFFLQILFGLIALHTAFGQALLSFVSEGIQNLVNYTGEGVSFVLGDLSYLGSRFVFAIHVLPVLIVFSSLVSLFYYLGATQWLIRNLGGGFQKLLGIGSAESACATANMFLGQTESIVLVSPYVNKMTKSELFSILTVGMASVSSATIGGYSALGVDLTYLLMASLMAVPGGLLMAKIIYPEHRDHVIQEQVTDVQENYQAFNAVDAIVHGAFCGLRLAINIGVILLVFVSLVALLNGIVGYLGAWFGFQSLTFPIILGYLFAPIAFILGVPEDQMLLAGTLMGERVMLNEFIAYASYVEVKGQFSDYTRAVIICALCGFGNLSSIAVLLGVVSGVAPRRKNEVGGMVFKAMIASLLANFMTAEIVGVLISYGSKY